MTDVFDALLTSRCSVYEKGVGSPEGYNQPNQSLTIIPELTDLACRLSTLSAGKEYMAGKEYATNSFKVFCRPQTTPITTHHWMIVTTLAGDTHTLNIKSVNDPSGMGHHLEIIGEEILP